MQGRLREGAPVKAGGLGTVARSVAVRVESELGEREEGTGLLGRGLPFPGKKPTLPAVPFWQARARNPVHAPGWALMSLVTALTLCKNTAPGRAFRTACTRERRLSGAPSPRSSPHGDGGPFPVCFQFFRLHLGKTIINSVSHPGFGKKSISKGHRVHREEV